MGIAVLVFCSLNLLSHVFAQTAPSTVHIVGPLAEAYPSERIIENAERSSAETIRLQIRDLLLDIDFTDEKGAQNAFYSLSHDSSHLLVDLLEDDPPDNGRVTVMSSFVTKQTESGIESWDKSIYPKLYIPNRLDLGAYDIKVEHDYNTLLFQLHVLYGLRLTFQNPNGAEVARKKIAALNDPVLTIASHIQGDVAKYSSDMRNRRTDSLTYGIISAHDVQVSEHNSNTYLCLEALESVAQGQFQRMSGIEFIRQQLKKKYGL